MRFPIRFNQFNVYTATSLAISFTQAVDVNFAKLMPYYRPTHFYCRATTCCYFSYIDAYFSLCFADSSYIWTTSTTLAPPVTGYPPLASVSMTRSPFIVSLLQTGYMASMGLRLMAFCLSVYFFFFPISFSCYLCTCVICSFRYAVQDQE